ncbi:nuclear transport factor 2 [Exidia glandulosa HHB12029]|uniref:Nuclear transport factor 2 n=1 Tax=Exidia glandulosa HHB12029 TaxID=1314781 RepID=A0A165MEC7_EXIGL|nr:nuclear transport factor 2 [Exidia glandulosa HHB12029]
MADVNAIAKQFVDYYYSTFAGNRPGLATLYRDSSMMTWEGQQIQGVGPIIEKLSSLPFEKVAHRVTTLDAQPSSPSQPSMIVLVTGLLIVDDSQNPLNFSQTFQLYPEAGTYFVQNDVFRLNYG